MKKNMTPQLTQALLKHRITSHRIHTAAILFFLLSAPSDAADRKSSQLIFEGDSVIIDAGKRLRVTKPPEDMIPWGHRSINQILGPIRAANGDLKEIYQKHCAGEQGKITVKIFVFPNGEPRQVKTWVAKPKVPGKNCFEDSAFVAEVVGLIQSLRWNSIPHPVVDPYSIPLAMPYDAWKQK